VRRVLVVLTAAIVVAPAGSSARPPLTTATLSAAYERWIVHRYPGPAGHWVCPVGDPWNRARGGVYCEAEFFGPTSWHFLYTLARIGGGRVRFVPQRSESSTWRRRWIRLPEHEPGSPLVNAPTRVHDWSWLATFAREEWRGRIHRRTLVASDGPISYEFRIFERFTCVLGRDVVTCTTPLGDAMLYRPLG
jgi:hypothetical protein